MRGIFGYHMRENVKMEVKPEINNVSLEEYTIIHFEGNNGNMLSMFVYHDDQLASLHDQIYQLLRNKGYYDHDGIDQC